ncbi:DEAD/DEAH box helicase [Candidatus Woesearchaeota archaeon]|nr:DEAD/DEAH box helicase [Candidatus Woesearchaeota archaeon]MBW2994292.1 DEAD/DEAH box helicase [Candidatus Woesearchaeota archaeon]
MRSDFKPRLYQETILSTCVEKNCLVVLPTGMGKTAIAVMLAKQRLANFPTSKILILAPTKPLAKQHLNTFKDLLDFDDTKMVLFTGEVPPKARHELWENAQIIFSTPQGLENDVISKKVDLRDVSLIVFDEAHRAVGDYAYVFIAKQYDQRANFPKILALTASPGTDVEKITEVCQNLHIQGVEIRSDSDSDVAEYIQDVQMKWVKVDLPPTFSKIQKFLNNCIKSKISEMKKYGLAKSIMYNSKRELLALQKTLYAKMSSGDRDFSVLKSISLLAEAMKVQHALELLESQGISALNCYLDKIFSESKTTKVKATQNLVADINFKSTRILTQKLFDAGIDHPKLAKVKETVAKEFQDNPKSKIILFTQYRDSASKLFKDIKNIPGVFPVVFVGQAKKGNSGLSQKKQIEILDEFRDGLHNVLIATSVAEEGLDIPKVDLVMFYEPLPSAIRTIQRRGRTGRLEKGRVIVFLAKNTRDEGYRWASFHKEKRMHKILDDLKKKLKLRIEAQPKLAKFCDNVQAIKIFADYREKGSGTIKELCDLNVNLKLEMLDSADYILSSRVGVEIKKVKDFVDSIVDGRLLGQLKVLKEKFERPIVIIEGQEDLFSVRNVHPNAIRGMLATIAVSYGIPIIHTKDFKDTANTLLAMARREQEKNNDKDFSLHTSRKPLNSKEQQEYIISAMPSVGPSAAKELLKHFKSVKNIINADEKELKQVNKVGDKIAKAVKDVVEKEYSD